MLTPDSRLEDFPSLAARTYLNTAAEGIPPLPVIDALHQYARDKILGMDGRELHEIQWAEAKSEIAQAYNLTADEIGICSCTSEAYNMAAVALQLQEGDEVVINDLDFPAGATPWLQPACPAAVHVWRSRDGALRVDDLVPLLNEKTRLLTVSLVSFFNGFKIPLDDVRAAVRRHSSALLALDVTQALGRVPLDLDDVDFETGRVEIGPGEVPLFWGCGCTPQAAAMKAGLDFMIAHKAGHLFITDTLSEEIAAL